MFKYCDFSFAYNFLYKSICRLLPERSLCQNGCQRQTGVFVKGILNTVIIFNIVSFSFADDVSRRGHAILDDFYRAHKDDAENLKEDDYRTRINWSYATLVLFENGIETQRADKILFDTLDSKSKYFSKRGSAGHDLYWELVILSRMVNAPEVLAKLSDKTEQAIKAVLWDFVFSFDRAGYCDASIKNINVIYNSDNHDMIHRCIFLMSAQALKNDPSWKTLKYADGTNAERHFNAWRKNLLEYFRFRAMTGVNVEFGSSVYAALYLQPIFNIYDYCEDKTLAEQSGKFITLYFADAAQETLGGIRGGAKVRVYKTATAYSYLRDRLLSYNHILAGVPVIMPFNAPTDCFTAVCSKYRLPSVVRELITDINDKGSYSYKSNRLAQGTHILGYEYEKGAKAPIYTAEFQSGLLRYTYSTPDYILGTFTIDETKNYMLINAQNQWMGLITSASPQSRLVVHLTPTLDERTGCRELQAVQYKNSAIIRKQLAANDTSLMRIYFSDEFKQTNDCNVLLFENDKVYVGVICAHPKAKNDYEIVKTDLGPGKFITFRNPDVFIVLEVAMKDQYQNLKAFSMDIADNKLRFDNNNDMISYESSMNNCTLTMYTYNKMPEVNGVPVDVRPKKIYDSPYIEGYFKNPRIKITGVKGNSMILDFNYN
jgi:hypothetical protein